MASLWELGPIIFGPTEVLVSWLQRKGMLASSQTCSSCGVVMQLGKRSDISDGTRMEVCGGVPIAKGLRLSGRAASSKLGCH